MNSHMFSTKNFSALRTVAGVAGALLLTACGSASDDASSGSNEAITTVPQNAVTVTSRSHSPTVGQCVFSVETIEVDVPDAALKSKLNEALYTFFPQQTGVMENNGQCDVAATLHGQQVVTANGRGLLSVVYHEDFFAEGQAHPGRDVRSWNLDATTGERIDLNAAFDAAGLAAILDSCKNPADTSGAGAGLDQACDEEMNRATPNFPVYAIEKRGVRIYPTQIAFAQWDVYNRDGILVPWTKLSGHVTNAKISDFAAWAQVY